jgi:hypothetical protein
MRSREANLRAASARLGMLSRFASQKKFLGRHGFSRRTWPSSKELAAGRRPDTGFASRDPPSRPVAPRRRARGRERTRSTSASRSPRSSHIRPPPTTKGFSVLWRNATLGRLFQLDLGQLNRNIVVRPLIVEISDDSQRDNQCDDNQRREGFHPTSSGVTGVLSARVPPYPGIGQDRRAIEHNPQ